MPRRKKEKSPMIDDLIEVLEKLKNEGIDITKLHQRRNNMPVVLKDEVSEEIIEKLGLEEFYPLGQRMATAISVYNKKRGEYPLTEEHKTKLENLGIVQKKSSIEKLIDILEILKKIGIQINEIPMTKKINGEQIFIKLSDIVSSEKLEKYDLDGEYKIGDRVTTARRAYRGHDKAKITEEQKRKLEELGIISVLAKSETEQQELRIKQQEALNLYNTALISWAKDNKKQNSKDD